MCVVIVTSPKATGFYFSVLEKIQNLMREGGKKNRKKTKTFHLFSKMLMRATK